MGQFSNEGLESWVINRMLNFLNRAKTAEDISAGAVMDDPFEGPSELGYVIGDVVAQRIIDHRDALPSRKFTEIAQLNGISGLGEDKFNDLVYTFSMTGAESFKRTMYRTVLFDNWDLQYDSTRFEDVTDFQKIVDDECNFQTWVAQRVGEICERNYGNHRAGILASRTLEGKPIEVYESGHLGSYALAMWFYTFDLDNWFTFEQVQKQTETYLDFFPQGKDQTELRLFKGFENSMVLADAITVADLPVVVNRSEQTISIWSCQLND